LKIIENTEIEKRKNGFLGYFSTREAEYLKNHGNLQLIWFYAFIHNMMNDTNRNSV